MFHQFRQQQLLEVKGMAGNDYSFTLTAAGRAQATGRSEVCQYVGPAPVSIQQYTRVVKSQAAKVKLNRDSLRHGFHDLVLPDAFLDQLGPALIGQQSLFLYGGTGNGKTSIAERILRIYKDHILVPYAIEVSGHIITVFDPVVHRAIASVDETLDPRWVTCERPCITVGGELCAAMLELRLDEATRVFISPCQLKANNGIFIVDDFGRQVLSPRELLNRWIVPLDRPRRLPDARLRHEISSAVRADGGLLNQPESSRAGRRSVPPPHSDEGTGRQRQRRSLRRDLPARSRIAAGCLRAGLRRVSPRRLPPRRRRRVPARVLSDRYLPHRQVDFGVRRAAVTHDARRDRPRRLAVFRQILATLV